MSKQDRSPARTPADIERKYNFGKSFSEVLGVANDARDFAEEAKAEAEALTLRVEGLEGGLSAQFTLSIEEDDKKTFSLINGEATKIHFKSDSILIESTNFTLQEDGTVKIKKGDIGGCSFDGEGNIIVPVKFLSGTISANQINADGITASNVNLTGTIIATAGSFGNSHITTGKIYGLSYEGIYFGSTANDTFFGTANQGNCRAILALGALGGDADYGKHIILTNEEIIFGGLYDSVSWDTLRKVVVRVKNEFPGDFDKPKEE